MAFRPFARSVSRLLRALERFNSLGIAFVSLSGQIDTTAPTDKMIFPVFAAVAEPERSLIAERVRAGLRNAKAKGKRLGRPRVIVAAVQIAHLCSWSQIARELGLLVGTRSTKPLVAFQESRLHHPLHAIDSKQVLA